MCQGSQIVGVRLWATIASSSPFQLQMNGKTLRSGIAFPRRCGTFERLNVPRFPDCRSQVVGNYRVFFALPDSDEREDVEIGDRFSPPMRHVRATQCAKVPRL